MSDTLKSSAANPIYAFGPFLLEARERRLLKNGSPIALPPKIFDTLRLLVENAGHVVTKDELMSFLWPDTSVEEGNLTKNIWLIRKALGESEGESRWIETVPKSGYRFIAPVRAVPVVPPRAAPHLPAVPALPGPNESPSPSVLRRRRLLLAVAVAAGLAVAIGSTLGILRMKRDGDPAGPRQIGARRSIAVLGFTNLSGRSGVDWLSTAVSEMVSAELAGGERLRLVPAENVARLGGAPPAKNAGTLSRETLASLRARLGADLVLSGSYVAIPSPRGEAIRFDMTLQDTATGDALATVTETGNEGDLFDLVSSAGGRLRAGLGLVATASSETRTVAASLPGDTEAARLYADGLAKLRAFDALGARPLFEASIRAEADFGPAHEALSRAWSDLGYDENARTEAAKAFGLAGDAPAPIRTSAEARLAETQKKWARAESLVASLLRSHPDDLDAGLRLAAVQIAGGRAQEALTTLSALGALRAPERDDPRIDLARADAADALARTGDELAASRSAADKAARSDSTLLIAEARLREGNALRALGDPSRGRKAYEEAAALFRRAGDHNGEAEAFIGLANAASDAGKEDESRDLFRQARATFERIGNRKGEARVLSDLANLDWYRGDTESALAEVRQVLAINRSVDDPRGIVWGVNATGNILADQGQFESALALQEEGVALSRKIGDDGYLAYSIASRADTFLAQGRLEDARSNYEEALALSKKLRNPEDEATHENDLGNVRSQQGKLPEAESHYQRALALRRRLGLKIETAETLTWIAGLRNAAGRYAEAAGLAEEALAAFAGSRQSGIAATSLAAKARAELGLGKIAEARTLCGKARAMLGDNRQNNGNLPVLLEEVRVETAASRLAEAQRLLSELDARARKSGWLLYILEARRAAAEIEIRSGRRAEGLQRARALAEEADARGFGLVAAEARKLLGEPSASSIPRPESIRGDTNRGGGGSLLLRDERSHPAAFIAA